MSDNTAKSEPNTAMADGATGIDQTPATAELGARPKQTTANGTETETVAGVGSASTQTDANRILSEQAAIETNIAKFKGQELKKSITESIRRFEEACRMRNEPTAKLMLDTSESQINRLAKANHTLTRLLKGLDLTPYIRETDLYYDRHVKMKFDFNCTFKQPAKTALPFTEPSPPPVIPPRAAPPTPLSTTTPQNESSNSGSHRYSCTTHREHNLMPK